MTIAYGFVINIYFKVLLNYFLQYSRLCVLNIQFRLSIITQIHSEHPIIKLRIINKQINGAVKWKLTKSDIYANHVPNTTWSHMKYFHSNASIHFLHAHENRSCQPLAVTHSSSFEQSDYTSHQISSTSMAHGICSLTWESCFITVKRDVWLKILCQHCKSWFTAVNIMCSDNLGYQAKTKIYNTQA